MVTPLINLIKDAIPQYQGDKEQRAFKDLKEVYLKDPILKIFDLKKLLRIETDALDLAIGIYYI